MTKCACYFSFNWTVRIQSLEWANASDNLRGIPVISAIPKEADFQWFDYCWGRDKLISINDSKLCVNVDNTMFTRILFSGDKMIYIGNVWSRRCGCHSHVFQTLNLFSLILKNKLNISFYCSLLNNLDVEELQSFFSALIILGTYLCNHIYQTIYLFQFPFPPPNCKLL